VPSYPGGVVGRLLMGVVPPQFVEPNGLTDFASSRVRSVRSRIEEATSGSDGSGVCLKGSTALYDLLVALCVLPFGVEGDRDLVTKVVVRSATVAEQGTSHLELEPHAGRIWGQE